MRQLDADLRRFFARRIVRGTILLALLITLLAVTIPTVRGHPPAKSGSYFSYTPVQVGTTPDGRPVYSTPTPPGDTRIDVGKSLESTLEGISVLTIFVGVVLGASFVGAEYHLGSLTSQLLYEPRRWRLYLAKAAAVAIGCAAFAVGLCLLAAALMYAGSEAHGVVRGISASWWRLRGVQIARAAAVGAAAAAMGYTVAVVTRRTSAAIVTFFVMYPFIFIVHPNAVVFGPLSRYAPMRGLLALAIDPRRQGDSGPDLVIHTTAGAIALTVVWIVALVAASGGLFSRSEVR